MNILLVSKNSLSFLYTGIMSVKRLILKKVMFCMVLRLGCEKALSNLCNFLGVTLVSSPPISLSPGNQICYKLKLFPTGKYNETTHFNFILTVRNYKNIENPSNILVKVLVSSNVGFVH